MDRWLSTQEFAEFIGLPVETIYYWRKRGSGPRGVKIGRHVKYKLSEIDAWLDELRDGQETA